MRIPQSGTAKAKRFLHHRLIPVFKDRFEAGHELVGYGAVDDPMVETQLEVSHQTDGDRVIANHGALLDGAHAENRNLRLMDDGRAQKAAIEPRVRYRKGAAVDIVHAEVFGACALGEISDRLRVAFGEHRELITV